MRPLRVGSLCSGYGGLELGALAALDRPARVVWHAEIDPHAARVLEHRFPGVPNLGDISKVDWSGGDRPGSLAVDVVTAGFP